jgi:hypothetical protein
MTFLCKIKILMIFGFGSANKGLPLNKIEF